MDATASTLIQSEPGFYNPETLAGGQMIINLGPQHPSTHGVLRLEALTDGEVVMGVVPHIGYLHRCFEMHAQSLPFNQIIPFVDRMDYLAAMNSEHVFCMAVERALGMDTLEPRVEFIRMLVCELNRIASHCVAIGTYGLDIGAFTPFLWLLREREHIQRLLEWVCGSRMLYNYIWVGGLFYDLPIGFESQCRAFLQELPRWLDEVNDVLVENEIFIGRTASVGILTPEAAVSYACTGPMLRASGIGRDMRRHEPVSLYNEVQFDIPIGTGAKGTVGDCWDRNWVRMMECYESVKIALQCLDRLEGDCRRTPAFDPQAQVPKKIRPEKGLYAFSAETPRGELGFIFETDGRSDVPMRCKGRSPCFAHLAALPEMSRGVLLADLIAVTGSLDLVMGEVDR